MHTRRISSSGIPWMRGLPPAFGRTLGSGLLALSLGVLAPASALAESASIQVGDPTQDGTVEITIYIAKVEKGRHGHSVKVKVPIDGDWDAARKAREIRKEIKKKIGRNGFTVDPGNDAVVRVRNNNVDWPIEITKTADDTGEGDTARSSSEGAPSSPPEDISYRTRMKLEGVPTEGLVTFGENDLLVTVPTADLTVDQIYAVFQESFGGTVQSDGLLLPVHTQSSTEPLEKSFYYEVTDPALSIEVTQDRIFDHRDLLGGDCRFTVTNHGTLGFIDGSQESGSGFLYPSGGENHLYIGGVWLGLSPEQVLNRDFDADPSPDWEVSVDPDGAPRYDQLDNYAQALSTVFRARDTDGTEVVTHLTGATFDLREDLDDFVLLTIRHESIGPRLMHGAFSGVFLDLDVLADGADNFGSVYEEDGIIYLTGPDPGTPWIGLSVARTGDDCAPELPVQLSFVRNSIYIWPEQHIADPDKWGFLSGAEPPYRVTDAPEPDDYSVVASVGPFDLFPGDVREVQFILAGGATLDELVQNIATAQSIVCDGGSLPSDVPAMPSTRSATVSLAAFPNPVIGTTRLSYQLTRDDQVTIELFDSNGRRVRRFDEGSRPSGHGETLWDGSDDQGRGLASGTYFARIRTSDGIGTTRLTLIR